MSSSPDDTTPLPGSGRAIGVRLGVLAGFVGILVVGLTLTGGAQTSDPAPYDKDAGWEKLWAVEAASRVAPETDPEATDPATTDPATTDPGAEPAAPAVPSKWTDPALFASTLTGLDAVVVTPPPEPGTNYNPEFGPLLEWRPNDAEWLAENGWITTKDKASPPLAMPDAPRGGTLRLAIQQFPPTMRTEGPNSRLSVLTDIHNLIYQKLLGYDFLLGDFVPMLASHWKIGEDKRTFTFRLDERAHWPNGQDLTADDVLATIEHMRNPDRKDALVNKHYEELIESATVLDRYTIQIVSKDARWRSLVTIGAGTNIYSAAFIRMDGETYLNDWNWKLPPGTGPYELFTEDIRKGRSIIVRHVKTWWMEATGNVAGEYNFDAIRWDVVRERELMYQKFLAGELDLYIVSRAQRWVDELRNEPAIQKGWIQMRRVFNKKANGYGGYCFNMRNAPFDTVNTRKAFACLFNREKLFEKLFFNQYEFIDSYFPGGKFARPDAANQRIRFDPEEGRRLLAEDGWTRRDSEGYLTNDRGERFPTIKLTYALASWDRIHGVIIDDLWNEAGIKMELELIDYAAMLKRVWDKKYQVVFWSWTASLFPDPEQQIHSKYADEAQSNNLNGFKDDRVDEILDGYKLEFDEAKRLDMLHEIDQILFDSHMFALGWYGPNYRILYWDKFGHPPEYGSPAERDINNVTPLWWFDAEKAERLELAKSRNESLYPDQALSQYDAVDQKWWLGHMERMPRPATKKAATKKGDE